jgi:TolB-like protein/Flp pilus assembly protein TadD/predicted Ser/Thr protein kinase
MIGKTISHYTILEKLGEGGMGVVYKAEDAKLKRIVALKFLPQYLTSDANEKERFYHEARAASALSHPNITTIYEMGEYGGQLFIAMEYVEGRTLKELAEKEPPSLEKALEIAIQVGEGLAAAHEKGIVHRDIKSENVMVTPKGQAKIMDFGLAKVTGATRLTRTGSTLGTAAYMSPEQAQGEEVDERSDIFSFGVVMYELLTGKLPFRGEHEAALLYSIVHESPIPISSLRRDLPVPVASVISRALEKDRRVRYQSANELIADVRRLAAQGATPPRREQSIAVLPFTNLSADKENEYFSDGLAEDIIDALTQVPGLRVMARTSAFSFRGREVDVREIGARLGVEHILEGSVRRSGSRLRVTAQLVKASDGYHLWSQRFDRELTDVFAIQDEISQAIVAKLRLRLAGDRPLVKQYTRNAAAYDLCLKARYHILKMTQEGREAGRRYCEQAIALDPNYAPAYIVLAESYLWSAFWGSAEPREAFARAKSAALEALRLDNTIADAHIVLGTVLGSGEFDWRGAEREYRRALELSPSSAVVRYDYAWCYAMWFLYPLGRVEDALAEMRRALVLDPLDPFYNSLLGYLLHSKLQFEPAVVQLRHAIDLDQTFFFSHWFLSAVYAYNGRLHEAIAEGEKANELSGGHPLTLGALGSHYGQAGRVAEARQILEELKERRRSTYVPSSALSWAYAGVGELDKILEWISRGIEERDPTIVTALKSAPTFDPLQSHPAYPALLRKMNLEP